MDEKMRKQIQSYAEIKKIVDQYYELKQLLQIVRKHKIGSNEIPKQFIELKNKIKGIW